MMKIKKEDVNVELFVLCHNEEKMILHTLNYYAPICSKITIIDNYGTDKSLELAKAHPFE